MRSALPVDTGFRAGTGRGIGVPGYDVATTNWQTQVGKARVGGITTDGRRLDGGGRGLFTKDRVRRQPTKLERAAEAQATVERAKNEGTLGAAAIQAGASRYGADRQLAGQGLQEFGATRRAGMAERGAMDRTRIGEQGATERAGIAAQSGEKVAGINFRGQIGSARLGARGGLDQQRIAADASRDVAGIQADVEREKIAAASQPKGLPGVVNVGGIWHTQDAKTGETVRLPDSDQKRLTMVQNLANGFPQSVTRKELAAFTADPNRFTPVYDYQTGRVALKPSKVGMLANEWSNDTIGSGDKAQLRYQPLADFEPTAYQAFLEWANAYSGAQK